MLAAQLTAGKTLSEALSNPVVKGGWDEVMSKVFGKYEDDMQVVIKKARAGGVANYTVHEKKALDLIEDIYGASGIFDFKARNEQTGKRIALGTLSVLAGA